MSGQNGDLDSLDSPRSSEGAGSFLKQESSSAKSSDALPPYDSFSVSLAALHDTATALDVHADDCGAAAFECEPATLKAKVTLAPSPAPGSRSHSPSPLLWSEPGWTLGSFNFAPFGNSNNESASSDAPSVESSQMLASSSERKSSLGSSDLNEPEPVHEHEPDQQPPVSVGDLVRDLCETPCIDAKPARSKLIPTAEPFAPKALVPVATAEPLPAVNTTGETRTRPRPFPIDVHLRARQRKGSIAPLAEDVTSSTSSPLEPFTPPVYATREDAAQFDADGRLVSHGAKYNIADEILQLQTTPLSPSFSQDLRGGSFDSYLGDAALRLRTTSEQVHYLSEIDHWRHEHGTDQYVFGTSGQEQHAVPFPSMSSHVAGPAERGRSMSLASATSLASPFRPALERANTVAQLQSYFGPPTGDLNVPLGTPAPLDTYGDAAGHFSYPPSLTSSHELSRTPSYASLSGVGGAPYPPLAHPEPFNLTPDDPLYVEARETFVDSSCSSLAGPPTLQHRQTMAAHFDRAMHTLNPLASLFGLSQDAANHLLADPPNSGVNELVLKVAAMRGRQEQMASVQRSAMGMPLPGPSPNNRKLNLYKTELCRSWEEKGSCRYGVKCQFAHGIHELREVARHPKFKSEICRTFWTQGSCPYGKRCCFIHAVPDANSPNASPPKLLAPSTRPTTPSRTQARMTSTAITGAPSRTFGPALSELIGSSSSPTSAQNSPTQKVRADSNASSHSFGSASLESSALFGLGLRERPGQAPPTYKEAPQSRLQRLASLSAGPSSTSLASLGSAGSNTAFAGNTPCASGMPHARHDSAHSFFSSSSVSSAAAYSPLLTRSGSTSSLSSSGGSPVLHRISKDWLTSPTYSSSSAHLDWPAVEELSLEDPPHSAGAMLAQRFSSRA
ncbi:hypothetical protein JCM10908_003171 [Rhodotorula pacifica]|uniref:uncharacterized protein n=1 Tax=Rhodotorula pacifica TaxID=1495444 RepID=UPI0031821E5C